MTNKAYMFNNYFNDINTEYMYDNASFSPEDNIHPYPAKALPSVVHDLLDKLHEVYNIYNVLDPFVGSGTIALEAKELGLDFYGYDLNPLAILLARTKTLTVKNFYYIKNQLENFLATINNDDYSNCIFSIEYFNNIQYWFKLENISQLSYIKYKINNFLESRYKNHKEIFALILLTAFSSTVRTSSLSRNNEFKLYRIPKRDINNFKVDSILVFKQEVTRLLDMLKTVNKNFYTDTKCEISLGNAKNLTKLQDESIDLVMTSPPYGDSKTTVAYGQFSRLSLQWMSDLLDKYLGIPTIAENCDDYLLGGKHSIGDKSYSLEQIINISPTLKLLTDEMDKVVFNDLILYKKAKKDIEILTSYLKNSQFNPETIKPMITSSFVSQIINERIRLDILKKIKKSSLLPKRKIKEVAEEQTRVFIEELINSNPKKYYKRKNQLLSMIPKIQSSINTKILNIPRRKNEIMGFFYDLFQVVEETNRILEPGGIQVWIVGHRTVFRTLEIDLSNILLDWFNNLGYVEIKSLKRQCSFKRLPQHINSTMTRDQKIPTMLDEYIIIIQKPI